MPAAARWVGALVGLALLALLALVAFGNDTPDLDLPPREPGEPRVAWGEPKDGQPTGVVMLLHGGGWQPSDSGFLEQKSTGENLQDEGYATVAVGYDAGAEGFGQIEDVYEEARNRYPDLPICASGISAGGHLALMLATREPTLDCVLALVAPTDLTTLAKHDAEGDETYKAAVEVFGRDQLKAFSPARHADGIEADLLLLYAESDPIVPADQGRELARAVPEAELIVFPPGPVQVPWAHSGGVLPDAQETLIQSELDFLEEHTQGS